MVARVECGLDPRAHCPGTSWGWDEALGNFECVALGLLPGDVMGLGQALGDAESVTPGLLPGDVVGLHLLGCAF